VNNFQLKRFFPLEEEDEGPKDPEEEEKNEIENLKIRIQQIVDEIHKKYNINTEEPKKRAEREKETEHEGGSTGKNPSVENDQSSSSKSLVSLSLSLFYYFSQTSKFELIVLRSIQKPTCSFAEAI
jgi:hypothetical protein